MQSTISPILFYLVAFVALFGGLMLSVSKNLFHSALFMALSFFGIAGVYASMHLSFLAVVQIIVYVGAITILIIFGIMLTRHHGQGETNPFSRLVPGAAVVALTLAVLLSLSIRTLQFVPAVGIATDAIYSIGLNLFGFYILPTELAALLLLVAMIGAVMIAREEDAK